MFVEQYPYPHHQVDVYPTGQVLDTAVTVDVFQLRPGDQDRLIEWAGGGYAGADGGVLLISGTRVIGQLALGDFAVRDGGRLSVYPADGFYQRYQPVQP